MFSRNLKIVKKKFGNRHASKQTSFSYSIFHGFLQNMHQHIRKGLYFMDSSSSGGFEVLCRCLIIRKLNSINPVNHNLSFCEAKSSFPLVKYVSVKIRFTKRMLGLAPQKLRFWLIGLREFNFLKT
jgi:hypothetical protein